MARVKVEGTDLEAELNRRDGMVSLYMNEHRIAHGESTERALELARSYLATRHNALAAVHADDLHRKAHAAALKANHPPELAAEPTAPDRINGDELERNTGHPAGAINQHDDALAGSSFGSS